MRSEYVRIFRSALIMYLTPVGLSFPIVEHA